MVRIALIGDRSDDVVAHRAIDACFQLFDDVEAVWKHTKAIGDLSKCKGIWCVPGESVCGYRSRTGCDPFRP